MPDYAHPLRFGTFISPTADSAGDVLKLAQLTEDLGLDVFSAQDHPYQARFLDTWTLLSFVAARTNTMTVMPNVLNLPLRPPAVVAKSAASLDILSRGRVELGLGAGALWDAIAAMGGARRSPGQSVNALEEAITVVRSMWDTTQRSVRVAGTYYRLNGVHPGPVPAHDIGITLGAIGDRMLRLTGRLADGWLPSSFYVAPQHLARCNAIIDEAAEGAGRRPTDVRRSYNIAGSFSGSSASFLNGSPDVWAQQLAELTLTQGMSEYILASDEPDVIRRFAAEVVPAVRALVDAGREAARSSGAATVLS